MNENDTTTSTLRGHGTAPTYRAIPTTGHRVLVTAKSHSGLTGIITGFTWSGDAEVALDNGTTEAFYLPSLNRI